MRNIFAVLLAAILLLVFAGCEKPPVQQGAPTQPPTVGQTPEDTPAPTDNPALQVMQNIWERFKGEKENYLGGFGEDHQMATPWQIDLSDEAFLQGALFLSAGQMGKVRAAASVMHSMNTNNLTAGALALEEGVDYEAFAAEIKSRILDNQWVCGRPGGMQIVKVENCLLIIYGSGSHSGGFIEALQEAYPDAQTLCREAI